MSTGLKANSDGSAAIQVGGSDAIQITSGLAATFVNNATVSGNLTVTGTLTASSGVSGAITSGTAVSASGTSVNFTGIPSGVKRITVMFSGLSLSASSVPIIQIGAGTTPETTGYLGSVSNLTSGAATEASTTGFRVLGSAAGSNATVISGSVIINLLTGSTWVAFGSTARTDAATTSTFAYNKTITGTLGVVRITSVNGTDTFDAGSINIFYE
jgi:hypothetical protein